MAERSLPKPDTRVRFPSPAPENDKFRQKLVVFSYIRLTASYIHLRCVIFASQVICLRALGANIISLKPHASPAWWQPVNSSINGGSFYGSEEEAIREVKMSREYTTFFA